ncbi:MAG: alpha/beta fold hydrolase [Nocardiaceae bacterium]|nr:alpha/beta fold hydrolase [Nocardiaceae bacterium]
MTEDDEPAAGTPVSDRTRRAFGLLERFAPAVGARWAFELWCSVPKLEASLRMPPGVPAGEPADAYWDGHRIDVQMWGEGPTVYLVHGWGGCPAHIGMFIKPLINSGHRVIAFDLPSHNASSNGSLAPGRTTILECAKAVEAVVRKFGPAQAIVAHSLGAKAAAMTLEWGVEADRLVFLAPMETFDIYLDSFARRHGFGPRIRHGLHRYIDKRLGYPLLHTDIEHLALALKNPPPLLIAHDPDDKQSSYSTSQMIAETWPGAQLVTTRGLGQLAHYRILRNRDAIRAGLDFIQTPVDALT